MEDFKDEDVFFSKEETLYSIILMQELQNRFGSCDFILFGSRIRRDHRDDSDFDIVLIGKEKDKLPQDAVLAEEEAQNRSLERSGLKFDLNLQIFKDKEAFENGVFEYPFMKGVEKDGEDLKMMTYASLKSLSKEDQELILSKVRSSLVKQSVSDRER